MDKETTTPASPKILNVNDDEAIRYALSRILKSAGFAVTEARNGQTALTLAGDLPDLILLDVQLPDINGLDVCRALKSAANTARIPVLMISANFVRATDQAAGIQSGADGYLTHPISPGDLAAAINGLLASPD